MMVLCCMHDHTQITTGFLLLFLFMQCMYPKNACTTVSGEIIIKMMMNSKTSTKPLVVIHDEGDDDDYTNKNTPGKGCIKRSHNINSADELSY